MAKDVNLNFNFNAAEQGSIHGGLDAILAALNNPGVPYVNLTALERQATPSISNERLPYVQDAVENILPVFPALSSPSINLTRTTTLLELAAFIKSIQPKLKEIEDRFTDLGINAETIVYESMRDSYDTATRQEGRMPGADVFVASIAPLFAQQGTVVTRPVPASPTPA